MFVEADPVLAVERVSADAFFDAAYDATLARMIAHVVDIEGPVLDAVLARRITRAHGWQRTGSRIQDRVEVLAGKAHRTTEEDVGTFYWTAARGPELPDRVCFGARPTTTPEQWMRSCMAELVELAREVLTSGKSGEAAVVAMARELGLQRLREVSRSRFEKAMALAQFEG